jgi:hypothetical protein
VSDAGHEGCTSHRPNFPPLLRLRLHKTVPAHVLRSQLPCHQYVRAACSNPARPAQLGTDLSCLPELRLPDKSCRRASMCGLAHRQSRRSFTLPELHLKKRFPREFLRVDRRSRFAFYSLTRRNGFYFLSAMCTFDQKRFEEPK